MKKFKFKYRTISKAFAMLMLFVFCTTTLASDCLDCVCAAGKGASKDMKCSSVKKEMKCGSGDEKQCGKTENKSGKDCGNCTMKKSGIQNPLSTNENNTVKTKIIKVISENHSLNSGDLLIQSFNKWRPPDKHPKIFITLSNFRI